MKIFVILATLLACAYAKPGQVVGYNSGIPFGLGYNAAAVAGGFGYGLAGPAAIGYSAGPAITYAGGPALTYAAAPALTYASAPAIIAPAFTKTQYHAQDELGQASFGHAHPGQAHSAIRDAFGNVKGAYAYVNPEGKEIRVSYTAGHGGFQVESNALPQAPVHVLPPPLVAPLPVSDTVEVIEARAAHLKAIEEAKAANAGAESKDDDTVEVRAERKKRGAIALAAPSIAVAPLAYSSSYRYDVPALKTYAVAAPIVKTYAVAAPAPIVKTYAVAAPAPIVKTYAVAPAPIVKTIAYQPAAKLISYASPAVYSSYYSSPALVKSSLYSPYSSLGYGYGGYGYGYSKFY